MQEYNPQKIEKKWQDFWQKEGIYKNYSKDKKFYALDMFPYPSGVGLHVGHPKGYIATDIIARFKMLNDYSVLHPMGWDAFGLPAENYAIKNKVHPKKAVDENVATFKKQLEAFGFTYDWDKEINTTDPEYYKWTQWIFLKMFEKGLAFESKEPVNWCPECKTVLANEDVEAGKCERCGSYVEQKPLRQLVLKMTAYADRLLYDLDTEDLDWEEMILEQQRNWIGRSDGAEFELAIRNSQLSISVYTTRLDTAFGITYAVVAPEHKIIDLIINGKLSVINKDEILEYVEKSKKKTELDRTQLVKEKTGVELKGIKAVNPFNDQDIPVFVGDYVVGHYGTGAVMAVPAHDQRDLEFAQKYNLPVKIVICPNYPEPICPILEEAFVKDAYVIDSGEFTGLTSQEARQKMTAWLEKKGIGKKKVNYKMRDWVFSRQRYWGEPIPIVHCEKCGVVALPESELPLLLPEVESYEPTSTGESPLANITEWVNTTCPKCSGPAKRETNTMPQWAGSCWYYLRYIDPKNQESLIAKEKEKKWMPVDLYVGGAEHATRHLLYARFWHKFLYDIGVVSTREPFKKLVHVGLINAQDGRKMSKRWNNVINPDDVIAEYGADSLRLYEMFMGPFTQAISWNTQGLKGVRRFLTRTYNYTSADINEGFKYVDSGYEKTAGFFNKTIKKVTNDIENIKFNTAISSLMELVSFLTKPYPNEENPDYTGYTFLNKEDLQKFLIILSPFAPHLTEEL